MTLQGFVDIYVEVIADGFHLHPVTLALIFKRKPLDRIIIVSDFVKNAMRMRPAVRKGILAGSGMTLRDSCIVMKNIGLTTAEIIKSMIENPKRYLALK